MAINNYEQYAMYKEKKTELAEMLKASADVISELQMNQFVGNLKRLGEKVHDETFKIQIVGTFKNGKSTFINSFLGEEILPAYALPCTAIISEVKWGETKKAMVHFCDPLPDKLPSSLPTKAVSHMKHYSGSAIPPLEIPYDEIEDYTVIPIGEDPTEMLLESPYDKIELFWPLPLLENGVEIIDSPGLNEHKVRGKVTMDYLPKADAILFVLNAQQICSAKEMEFIEKDLKENGFLDPFFVVNRWDTLGERDKREMQKYVQMRLNKYSSNEISYVSARNGLDGKIENDEAKFKSSGIGKFEARLSDFLTKQKGKAKLSQPARELKRILTDEALFKIIPTQRERLNSSLDEVKQRYKKAQPKLNDLRMKKEQLRSRLLLRIEQFKPELKRIANRNITDITDSIPVWVEEYTPTTSLGLIPTKEKTGAVIKEISSYICEKIDEQQLDWRKAVLEPIIRDKATDIFESAEADITKIFEEIDSINVDLTGSEITTAPVPTWQRVVGVLGGLAIGDIGVIASGSVNGISREMAKTVAFEFGAGAALSLLGLFNPITLIAVIAGAVIFNLKKGESNAMKKIKGAVTSEMSSQLLSQAEKITSDLSSGVIGNFTELAEQIVHAVDAEINETKNQIDGIISEMEKGKENIARRQKEIDNCETKIKQISAQLDSLIFQLVEE